MSFTKKKTHHPNLSKSTIDVALQKKKLEELSMSLQKETKKFFSQHYYKGFKRNYERVSTLLVEKQDLSPRS